MRTLDLYLLRRLALCLSLAVVALLLVSVVIDLTENIDTFIDFEARPQQIVLYYLYRLPYWTILTLPIAALLGSLFALTSLARHNEIAAMKALGLSLGRILAPIFLSALCISALAFLFTDIVVARATLRHNEINDAIRSQQNSDGSRRQVLLQDTDGQLIFARNYDARQERADEISWERLVEGVPNERVIARRMFWRNGRWIAHQGRHYSFSTTGQTDTAFDSLALSNLTLTPQDFARQHKDPEEMSYRELSAFIKRATRRGEDVTRHRVDLHLKISFPLTCFIIIALGATLGANAQRTGLANSFGLGVFICFAYYSCLKAGQALGWNEVLTPWLGAWIANLFFAILALALFWRAHK
ncbi:MAG: lipopolysaccharide export system permease protein [Candidatus Latescibacterota bacterium]|jgi:lipopolysaccharide export system permease protein